MTVVGRVSWSMKRVKHSQLTCKRSLSPFASAGNAAVTVARGPTLVAVVSEQNLYALVIASVAAISASSFFSESMSSGTIGSPSDSVTMKRERKTIEKNKEKIESRMGFL